MNVRKKEKFVTALFVLGSAAVGIAALFTQSMVLVALFLISPIVGAIARSEIKCPRCKAYAYGEGPLVVRLFRLPRPAARGRQCKKCGLLFEND